MPRVHEALPYRHVPKREVEYLLSRGWKRESRRSMWWWPPGLYAGPAIETSEALRWQRAKDRRSGEYTES